MKRNFNNDAFENSHNEATVVEEKLRSLLSSTSSRELECGSRSIRLSCNGHWIVEENHVKISSCFKGLDNNLLKYSKTLGYYFMERLEAIYSLEMCKLVIFYNELPISISEAYRILLPSREALNSYLIFRHLNRAGFICLIPEIRQSDDTGRVVACRSIFNVTFDVYKRETYSKCKPGTDSSHGNPDFRLLVLDKSAGDSLSLQELESYESSLVDADKHELRFALVDDEHSMSFLEFKRMKPSDLVP